MFLTSPLIEQAIALRTLPAVPMSAIGDLSPVEVPDRKRRRIICTTYADHYIR